MIINKIRNNKIKYMKILSLAIMLALTVSTTGIVFADNASSSLQEKRQELLRQANEERERIREERASTTAALKEKLNELKNEKASTTANLKNQLASLKKQRENEIRNQIENRIGQKLDEKRTKIASEFEKAINNLNNLATRTESRINKLASSTDVTALRALLVIAKEKIRLADTELTTLENMLLEPIGTSTRKTIIEKIKNQSEITKTAIKTAHNAIVETIVSLKPGQLKNATSTNATSTN